MTPDYYPICRWQELAPTSNHKQHEGTGIRFTPTTSLAAKYEIRLLLLNQLLKNIPNLDILGMRSTRALDLCRYLGEQFEP